VYLTHSYAHTSAHNNFLPDSLKGADMSLWNTARALGLMNRVVPIMYFDWDWNEDEDSRHQFESKFDVFNGGNQRTHDEEDWGSWIPGRIVTWLNATSDKPAKSAKGEGKPKPKFKEVQAAYMTVSPQLLTAMRTIQAIDSDIFSQYSNEPGIGIDYTRAAMPIRIPLYHERYHDTAAPKSIREGIKLDPAEYGDYDDDDEAFSYSSYEESADEVDEMETEDDGSEEHDDEEEDGQGENDDGGEDADEQRGREGVAMDV
jgi:hypothetical protein